MVISGYETDPVARIDIVADLRYQWFDWILKGGYEASRRYGASDWVHAATFSVVWAKRWW